MKYDFDNTLDHRYNQSYRWKQPAGRDDVLGMDTADMDFYCPPCLKEATKSVWEENTFNYRMKPESYYQAIAGWYQRKYSLKVEKDWINSMPGTVGAIRTAIGLLTSPGDYVLMQTPYFGPLRRAIEGAGCRFLANPMVLKNGRYEIDFENLTKEIEEYRPTLLLLVNPHNPTGRVFTKDELTKIADICAAHNIRIISDEVHSHIVYTGYHHIPILAVSETARRISLQIVSLCKGYNTMSLPNALVVIADQHLRNAWEAYVNPYGYGYASNSYSIAATVAVLNEGDEWLREVTAYLEQNLEIFLKETKERHIPIIPLRPEAGFLLWIDCRRSGIDSEHIDSVFLEKAGIRLNNGKDHGEDGTGFVRLNFAVTRKNLLLALDRIDNMMKE